MLQLDNIFSFSLSCGKERLNLSPTPFFSNSSFGSNVRKSCPYFLKGMILCISWSGYGGDWLEVGEINRWPLVKFMFSGAASKKCSGSWNFGSWGWKRGWWYFKVLAIFIFIKEQMNYGSFPHEKSIDRGLKPHKFSIKKHTYGVTIAMELLRRSLAVGSWSSE